MQFWEKYKYKSSNDQFSFHLVCCELFDEELERIERVYFADFSGRKRAQVVNALLNLMEPFLRQHLNIERGGWDFSLPAGEVPLKEPADDEERVYMDRDLWVLLDGHIYRIIKKLHEGVESKRGGTFSMALVLRAVLIKCFELLDAFGRDGLVRWVKRWLKEHEEKRVPLYREVWKPLEQHIGFFESKNVKYIALYGETYRQMHLYHPPPGHKST